MVKTILYRTTMALGTSIDMCLDLAGNGSSEAYDEGDRNLADGHNRSFSSVDTATRNRSLRRPISTGFLIASQTDMPASALAPQSLLDSVHSSTNSTHTHTHTHTHS